MADLAPLTYGRVVGRFLAIVGDQDANVNLIANSSFETQEVLPLSTAGEVTNFTGGNTASSTLTLDAGVGRAGQDAMKIVTTSSNRYFWSTTATARTRGIGQAVEAWVMPDVSTTLLGAAAGFSTGTGYAALICTNNGTGSGTTAGLQLRHDGTTVGATVNLEILAGVWYRTTLEFLGSNDVRARVYDINGVMLAECVSNTTTNTGSYYPAIYAAVNGGWVNDLVGYVPNTTGWSTSGASFGGRTLWASKGLVSAQVGTTGALAAQGDLRTTGGATTFAPNIVPGRTYRMVADCSTPVAHSGGISSAANSRQRRILVYYSVNGSTFIENFGAQGANVAGAYTVGHTFTIPANATGVILAVGCASSPTDGTAFLTYVDNVRLYDLGIPEAVTLQGTITFVPSVSVVRIPGAWATPATVNLRPIVTSLDANGYLCVNTDQTGVNLVATDDLRVAEPVTWTVIYDLTYNDVPVPIPSRVITVKGGQSYDLGGDYYFPFNHVVGGSFEQAGSTAVLRTNLFADPEGTSTNATYHGGSFTTLSTVSDMVGGAVVTATRHTRIGTGSARIADLKAGTAIPASTHVRLRCRVRASQSMASVPIYYRPDVAALSSQVLFATIAIPAGYSYIDLDGTTHANAPTSAAGFAFSQATGTDGATLDITEVLIEVTPATSAQATAHPTAAWALWFSGANPPVGAEFSSAWASTPHASPSTLSLTKTLGTEVSAGVAQARSNRWKNTGTYSLRLTGTGTPAIDTVGGKSLGALRPSGFYTFICNIHLEEAMGSPSTYARHMLIADGPSGIPISAPIGGWPVAPNAPGTYELRFTVQMPPDPSTYYLYLMHGAAIGDSDVWWDDAIAIEVPDLAHPYTGPITFYQGDSPY